jgi:hypothetical protein
MTWQKLTLPKPSRVTGVTLRVTAKGYDTPHLVIRIARELAASGGIPSDRKSRVDVFLGAGADAGRMKIACDPDGAHACHPSGKTGALKIAFRAPPETPKEFAPTTVKAASKDGGVTFLLPWYRRAADRVVEEPPATLEAIEEMARPTRSFFGSLTPEQQTAALAYRGEENHGDPAFARSERAGAAAKAEITDKPVNGTARHHVYADSEDVGQKYQFAYGDKNCLLNKRQLALAAKLQKAMGKGFIDDNVLVHVTGVRDADCLHALVSTVRKAIGPLGLKIERQPKIGYFMAEG